jgi:hypothetical protein
VFHIEDRGEDPSALSPFIFNVRLNFERKSSANSLNQIKGESG